MANITSAGTGNSNDGATWTGGSVPTSSDNAIIQNGHTVTQNAAHTFKSLRVETGGTWTADGSNHLTLSGENDSDFALQIVDGTYNHANGTVVINNGGGGIAHAAIQGGVANSTTGLYDLTISGGGTTCEIYGTTTIHRNMEAGGATTVLRGDLTVNGNLTVYGALTTIYSSTSHNLTVNGTTTIGLGSGAADVSTLTCNASTVSLGALRQQADYAVNIEVGGTFVGGTGTHTFGSLYMAQSANAKATMTNDVLTVNGENTSANKAWRVEYGGDTFDNNNGTVKFAFNGFDSRFSMRSASHANNAFHNLIIAHLGDTRTLGIDNGSKLIVDNDLTITRGLLQMNTAHELVVGGDVEIDDGTDVAELRMGSSSTASSQAATFGSLKLGDTGTYSATSGTTTITSENSSGQALVANTGTFTHNNGTVTITTPAATFIYFKTENPLNNLILNHSSLAAYLGGNPDDLKLNGDLTITAGTLTSTNSGPTLDVDGDVDITGTLDWSGTSGGAVTLGSLTINSGGTYSATTGTTTITNQTGGGYGWYNVSGGTFTHNDGLVKFTDNASVYCQENTFYDLELNLTSVTLEFRWSDISGNTLNILNDFTISSGRFKFNTAGDNIIVHGLTKLESTSQFGLNSPSGTHTFNGLVTLNGGTWFLSSGTNNMAGIRNVGGTIS
jgi:hypothetical protein